MKTVDDGCGVSSCVRTNEGCFMNELIYTDEYQGESEQHTTTHSYSD